MSSGIVVCTNMRHLRELQNSIEQSFSTDIVHIHALHARIPMWLCILVQWCILLVCIINAQSKREDSDLRVLQDAMRKANEMDAVYLEEITGASPQFRLIREKGTLQFPTSHNVCVCHVSLSACS